MSESPNENGVTVQRRRFTRNDDNGSPPAQDRAAGLEGHVFVCERERRQRLPKRDPRERSEQSNTP